MKGLTWLGASAAFGWWARGLYVEREKAELEAEVQRLSAREKELIQTLQLLKMNLEPLLAGGTSEVSREFDKDIKREAIVLIDAQLEAAVDAPSGRKGHPQVVYYSELSENSEEGK